MPTRRYSELECFTLGLIWQSGPCSPYEVRRLMQNSPSTQWSGSAGAIYPLVRRLHKQGLLAARSEHRGKRRRREYTITAAGLKVLRGWIGPPLAGEAVTVSYDPLRSRARFLLALPPSERGPWVRTAVETLAEVAENVRRWHDLYAGADNPTGAILTRSGELDVQARQTWLRELGEVLGR